MALARTSEEISRMAQLECRFECEPPVLITSPEVAYHLYYIALEALNNALRHAGHLQSRSTFPPAALPEHS